MRTYRVRETYPYQGRTAERVAPEDFAATVAPWFEDMPDDVRNAIDELQGCLMRNEYHDDLAQYLGLSVECDDDGRADQRRALRELMELSDEHGLR